MADHAAELRKHEAARAALVEATAEVLEVYTNLASGYDATIARRSEHLESVNGTLDRVRDLIRRR